MITGRVKLQTACIGYLTAPDDWSPSKRIRKNFNSRNFQKTKIFDVENSNLRNLARDSVTSKLGSKISLQKPDLFYSFSRVLDHLVVPDFGYKQLEVWPFRLSLKSPFKICIISMNRWLISKETFKKLLHHHPLLQFSIKAGRGENQEDDEDFDGESANAQKRKVTKEKLAGIRFLVIRDTVFPGKGWR